MPAPRLRDIALWLHDKQCVSQCTGDARIDHTKRTQYAAAREMMAAQNREQLAGLVHAKFCPLWNERPHGIYFINRSDAACGNDGNAHASQMAESVAFKELAGLLGVL